jgi:hypothetical protein
VVYCKAPLAGPKQVLRYLSRYTHRVAISNRRLITADDAGIAFRWKDYRVQGPERWKTMRLHPHEFIRRFLLHVLPKGFHRIRHCGLLASANRADSIAMARALLGSHLLHSMSKSSRMSRPTRRVCCLPVSALWRPHDCHRGLRARTRHEPDLLSAFQFCRFASPAARRQPSLSLQLPRSMCNPLHATTQMRIAPLQTTLCIR